MRAFVRLYLLLMLAAGISGQQRGAMTGLPPVGPIPPLGGYRPHVPVPRSVDRGLGFPRHGVHRSFPVTFPIYPGGHFYQYPVAPNVIVIQQPAPVAQQPAAPKAPPSPARPEIREYVEASPAGPLPSQEEQPVFEIALKDGSVHQAVAVWAAGEDLHYIDTEGRRRRVSLAAIDRAATRRLNRQRNLRLPVPMPAGN
jgi:hypothetical protein